MKKTFKAWAIDENNGFLGRYYRFGQHLAADIETGSLIPQHMEGCVTALFKTRREAQRALKRVQPWRSSTARVRRVTVTVRTT